MAIKGKPKVDNIKKATYLNNFTVTNLTRNLHRSIVSFADKYQTRGHSENNAVKDAQRKYKKAKK